MTKHGNRCNIQIEKEKGITLTALVITIIILLILAGVGISVGRDTIESAKLMSFGTELQVMQNKVNELQQELQNKKKNSDNDGADRIRNIGQELQKTDQENLAFAGAEVSETNGYKYYDKNTVEELGFKNFNSEFLVNVEKRKVISLYGIKYRGKTIWTAEQLDGNDQYNVEYAGVDSLVTFDLGISDNKLLVKEIRHTGNVKKCSIYYGQGDTEENVSWKTAINNTTEDSCKIDIYNDGVWYVKVEDSARHSLVKNANVETVTFDSNGGNVNTTYKKIIVGQEYGELPTPTRDGYTFLGWGPESIFDLDDYMNTIAPYQYIKPEKVMFGNEQVWKVYGGINSTGLAIQYMKGDFKENTQYTISINIYDVLAIYNATGTYMAGISPAVEYSDGGYGTTGEYYFIIQRRRGIQKQWEHLVAKTNGNKTIRYISYHYGLSNAYSYIKNIRIVEGTEEYVTPSTTVIKNQKHKLTAMWQKNE